MDQAGRLVGMITADDVVHIIQEEASEDILRLSGAGEDDINEPLPQTVRRRLTWLIVNLGTAVIAAAVVGLFQGTISHLVALAVLMPIVSGMGGNAGTQTMAVAVRALALNQLTNSNSIRVFVREFRIVNQRGLHARASAKFVQVAGSFDASVDVEKDGVKVGGTSIMGLMMLAASPGCSIRVIASGPEARQALEALEELIATRFGEEI